MYKMRKRNERMIKKSIKLTVFIDNKIMYLENTKGFTDKL